MVLFLIEELVKGLLENYKLHISAFKAFKYYPLASIVRISPLKINCIFKEINQNFVVINIMPLMLSIGLILIM